MYITENETVTEEQFIQLCRGFDLRLDLSDLALKLVYKEFDSCFQMEAPDDYMTSNEMDLPDALACFLESYTEHTFADLEAQYGHLLAPDMPREPFYRYHTALLLAINEPDVREVYLFPDEPDKYLIFSYKHATDFNPFLKREAKGSRAVILGA